MSGMDVTSILREWAAGDPAALDRLLPLVYNDLRRLAAIKLRGEAAGSTLQATALVHEVYLRLAAQTDPDLQNRTEFFHLAARLMRRILVDQARRRTAAKRGGGVAPAEFDDAFMAPDEKLEEWIAVDDALNQFAALDPIRARIVELRYFAGLTTEEIAALLECSAATIRRDWAVARSWLARRLGGAQHGAGGLDPD